MATQIRLKRVGSTGQPRYRVVVADSRSPRDGRFIETLGHYNPTAVPAEVNPPAQTCEPPRSSWFVRPRSALLQLLALSAWPPTEVARLWRHAERRPMWRCQIGNDGRKSHEKIPFAAPNRRASCNAPAGKALAVRHLQRDEAAVERASSIGRIISVATDRSRSGLAPCCTANNVV